MQLPSQLSRSASVASAALRRSSAAKTRRLSCSSRSSHGPAGAAFGVALARATRGRAVGLACLIAVAIAEGAIEVADAKEDTREAGTAWTQARPRSAAGLGSAHGIRGATPDGLLERRCPVVALRFLLKMLDCETGSSRACCATIIIVVALCGD